jgi:hypothetical protein
MKFIVTKSYLNEVDVRLHEDSKRKLKLVLGWSAYAGAIAGGIAYMRHDNKKASESEENV